MPNDSWLEGRQKRSQAASASAFVRSLASPRSRNDSAGNLANSSFLGSPGPPNKTQASGTFFKTRGHARSKAKYPFALVPATKEKCAGPISQGELSSHSLRVAVGKTHRREDHKPGGCSREPPIPPNGASRKRSDTSPYPLSYRVARPIRHRPNCWDARPARW